MQVSTHSLETALNEWVEKIKKLHAREDKVKSCLKKTTPEKRDLVLGFEALRKRAPFW